MVSQSMKKLDNFSNCLSVLENADFKLAEMNDIYRIGIIGQFNLTFELAWKALQEIMKMHSVEGASTGSPREILQLGYKIGFINDSEVWLLMLKKRNNRATCAIPFVFPTIKVDGKPYYDGGIADPIPIRRSIEDGNEKNLIVLTRPEGYRKELSKSNKAAAKLLKRKYPHLPELLLNRHIRYNKTVRYCEQLEREGKAVILRPEYTIDSLEKDIDVLKQTYDMGYRVTKENINRIKELF